MNRKINAYRRIFELHIRIGFLITLVVFILGFMFIPEFGNKPYKHEVRTIIKIDNMPSQLENIIEPPPPLRPKMPIAAENDEDIEAETIDKTNYIGSDGKTAEIELEDFFVVYEVPPKPLNLDRVEFPYPEVARRLGITGTVFLELWIDKEGNVRNVILTKSVYPVLDEVAVQNAWKLKFSPAIQWDKKVAVRYSFPVHFELD